MPTVPAVAPLRNLPAEEAARFRNRALSILCVAGLGGLPQISMPLAAVGGLPVGLSILGPAGPDRALLPMARGDAGTLFPRPPGGAPIRRPSGREGVGQSV